MSRREIPAGDFTVTVGWDRPLQTFFAQVAPEGGCEDWELPLWVGRRAREINSVEELADAVKGYVAIPQDVRDLLNEDRWEGYGEEHPWARFYKNAPGPDRDDAMEP